jgi:hypothetical protein
MPPAIAPIDTTREMIKASFLRDMSNPPEDFRGFHARWNGRFQKSLGFDSLSLWERVGVRGLSANCNHKIALGFSRNPFWNSSQHQRR